MRSTSCFSFDLTRQCGGLHLVQLGEVGVEHDLLLANQNDSLFNSLQGNRLECHNISRVQASFHESTQDGFALQW